jgi:hypothetical protein
MALDPPPTRRRHPSLTISCQCAGVASSSSPQQPTAPARSLHGLIHPAFNPPQRTTPSFRPALSSRTQPRPSVALPCLARALCPFPDWLACARRTPLPKHPGYGLRTGYRQGTLFSFSSASLCLHACTPHAARDRSWRAARACSSGAWRVERGRMVGGRGGSST